MIACAASAILPASKPVTKLGICSVIRAWGKISPITPVDEENTRSFSIESAEATDVVIAVTASEPLCPVKALALPELTIIAAPPDVSLWPIFD